MRPSSTNSTITACSTSSLYDVWTDLYGRAFVDRMVSIERRIPGRYDYDAAWTWALAMTREER